MRSPVIMTIAEPIPAQRGAAAIAPMKRKAVITVEYEAEDSLEAMAQEDEIRRVLTELKPDFDRIDIRFADRRPRHAPRAAAPSRCWPRD